MRRICSRLVVLERLVVRNVVGFGGGGDRRSRRALAAGRAVAVRDAQVEASGEEAPRHAFVVEQVADVLTAELHRFPSRGRAHVAHRISVAHQRQAAIAIADG